MHFYNLLPDMNCVFVFSSMNEFHLSILILTAKNCPEWSLATPKHGSRTCTNDLSSSGGQRNCTITCDTGYGFVVAVPDVYTCVGEGDWEPHNYVPDCACKLLIE